MSLLEKIKSMFSGGSGDADAHAGHDHTEDPVPAPNPLADDESTPA